MLSAGAADVAFALVVSLALCTRTEGAGGKTVERLRYDFAGANGDGLNPQGTHDAVVSGVLGTPGRPVELRLVFSSDAFSGHAGHVAIYNNGSRGSAGSHVRHYSLSSEHGGQGTYHDTVSVAGYRWRAAISVVRTTRTAPWDGEWYVGPNARFMPPVWHGGRPVTVDISWKHLAVSREVAPRETPMIEVPILQHHHSDSARQAWARGCIACTSEDYKACVAHRHDTTCIEHVVVCLCPDLPESTLPQVLFDHLFAGANVHSANMGMPNARTRRMSIFHNDERPVMQWDPSKFMATRQAPVASNAQVDADAYDVYRERSMHAMSYHPTPSIATGSHEERGATGDAFQAIPTRDHVIRLTRTSLWHDVAVQYELGGGERRTVRVYARTARDEIDGWVFGISLAANLVYACIVLVGIDMLRVSRHSKRNAVRYDAIVANTTWFFLMVAVAVHTAAYSYALVETLRGVSAHWHDIAAAGRRLAIVAAIGADAIIVSYVLLVRWRNMVAGIVLVTRSPIVVARDLIFEQIMHGYDVTRDNAVYRDDDDEDDIAMVHSPDFEDRVGTDDDLTLERVKESIQRSDYGRVHLDAVLTIMLLLDIAMLGSAAALLSSTTGTLGGDILLLIAYLVTSYHAMYYLTLVASTWRIGGRRVKASSGRRGADRAVAYAISYGALPAAFLASTALYVFVGPLAILRTFINRYSDVHTGGALTIVSFFVTVTTLLIASGAATSDIHTKSGIYAVPYKTRRDREEARCDEALLVDPHPSSDDASRPSPWGGEAKHAKRA